ncbi:hypothetical protein [Neobacillus drentensis]|uniref:hypothetical protein n=1 Tax=Neobacillus drentensis TaxID=220684 RepID=UPI002FFEC687
MITGFFRKNWTSGWRILWRVGLKTSKSYSIRRARGIRGSSGLWQRGNKGAISPGGWEDPKF